MKNSAKNTGNELYIIVRNDGDVTRIYTQDEFNKVTNVDGVIITQKKREREIDEEHNAYYRRMHRAFG